MLSYHVVLLLMTWPCVRTEIDQITPIPDQVADASTNIKQALKKTLASQQKLPSTKYDLGSTTVHYDNSNGFRPIVVPDTAYELSPQNVSDYDEHFVVKSESALEDDPAYSTEARILLNLPSLSVNRRSFNGDSQYNEFELLKVINDTPTIANYQDFYDDPYSANEESDLADYNRKKVTRYRNTGTNFNNDKHYMYNNVKENTRKVVRNKNNQNINTNYNPPKQTNTEERNKYFQPVVVVDPANYKVNMNFRSQSATNLASTTPRGDTQYIRETSPSTTSNRHPQELSNILGDGSTSRHYDRGGDSKITSDESTDYSEVTERSRKTQKGRRRPYSQSSRKLPKEHREIFDESIENDGRKRYNHQRHKQRHRQRNRPNWSDDGRYNSHEESIEDHVRNNNQHLDKQRTQWSQLAPNVEISQSSGYEVNQIEKPKLVPIVPVNIVPIGNFDHATALGNSQGFDVSNAMLQSFVTGTTLVSTASPLISTPQTIVKNTPKNANTYGIVTPVPEVIVGQNTIQSPVQTVFFSQTKPHQSNDKTQFLQTSVAPVYAITTTASPTTAKPLYAASTTATSLPHLALNHIPPGFPVNQLLVPQTAIHTVNVGTNQGTTNTQGQQSAKAQLNGNIYQVITPKSKGFLQQGAQLVPAILHNMNLNNQNQNTYNPFVSSKSNNQNVQLLKATNDAFESSMRQLQLQLQKNQALRLPASNLQSVDAVGSTSNSNANVVNVIPGTNGNLEKAQLPTLGTKNVEILNPNLKQNQIGVTFTSPIGVISQYPAATLTTPLPLLSTTNFATVRPVLSTSTVDSVGLKSYVDTLTELGTKINSGNSQPMYNPINFVPSLDVLKSQSYLNSKDNSNDPLPQGLNLVPSIPGGSFYKNNQEAQHELVSKPKISSDLERYAEEMLKESLRTIYNSHKWNNDRKLPRNISLTDTSAIARFKNELLRLKNSLNSKDSGRDILEAQHTDNKYHVIESRPLKSESDYKKPDFSVAKLEELLTNDFKLHAGASSEPIHIYHHHGPKHGHNRNHGRHPEKVSSHSNDYPSLRQEINDYLTPPRLNSFVSKSPFHDKPVKKRPGRFNHDNARPRSKTSNLDSLTSNSNEHRTRYGSISKHPYGGEHGYEKGRSYLEYRKRPSLDFYPALTTSYPEDDHSKYTDDHKGTTVYDINHPRTHNLLGLLMKNTQLPTGTVTSYSRNDDNLNKFFEYENRRKHPQNYDSLISLQKKSDVHTNLNSFNRSKFHSRNYSRT